MALQKQHTTQHGIFLDEAYCKIDTFRGDRHNVRVGVSVYANHSVYSEGKPAIESLEFNLPTPNSSDNMFAEVYNYLKTQPEFDGAVDV